MEEKRYPAFEEEESIVACCEPMEAVAVSSHGGVMEVHDELDDLDWRRYPVFGPKTTEEAIARANQAWEDRNDPTKWVTSEQMWNQLYDKFKTFE